MLASPLLSRILAPLSVHFDDPKTVELRMNRPGKVIVERREDGKFSIADRALGVSVVEDICRSLANINRLKFDPDAAPKVSCILDGGHRFECLMGASVQSGLSLAVRCKHPFTPAWDEVGADTMIKAHLLDALLAGQNIIVSGATNTGKTTLLNMMLASLPANRRVIAVEDTPELHINRFWDGVGLVAAREAKATAGRVGWRELYDHMMRITPDHIIFGEISTENAFAALAALNSGVSGFMCTIHAESPEQAITRKFEQNIAWAGENMPRVPEFLADLVDLVVQIKRAPDGWRRISDIYEPKTGRFVFRHGIRQSEVGMADGMKGHAA